MANILVIDLTVSDNNMFSSSTCLEITIVLSSFRKFP